MTTRTAVLSMVLTAILLAVANNASAQLMSTCAEDSPERRGEIGCTIVATKPLPDGLQQPLFWHIDRFDSLEQARAAEGSTSIALDAAGTSWLMTIESRTSDHHGGRHVADVGPLVLPAAAKYSMLIQSAAFTPGMYSLVHHHSGVEAVYVVDGEACYETLTQAFRLQRGETLAMPANTLMRAVVTGSTRRHILAVIVYDAAQPPTMRMKEGSEAHLVACK